ncbi:MULTISPECIES: hypothetical protein [unclassified Pseudomonas]|uniref:hypothetical protein n=1 Tax=unclassified Pseudomonas TaxID=196821 RepID=UPI00244AE5D8|nr:MULTISPECIES: hypothetical protein [unclassified Pseudomonas]MDG9923155.1 hypothetical protein [Pseudomonas sp. GD04045]MDH0034768.1 hypothetical protein [Pseudomonas sp. GD04019]
MTSATGKAALLMLVVALGGCISDPDQQTSWCWVARAFEGYQSSHVQAQTAQARRDNQVEASRNACQWIDG